MRIFRLRKKPLPFIADVMLLFLVAITVVLIYQLYTVVISPTHFDWLIVLLLIGTILIFLLLVAGVWLFDLQAQMWLNQQGIQVEPTLFPAYTIAWDDIAELNLQERQGLRLIEYKLKPGSSGYQALYSRLGRKAFERQERRSGGFHGWLPTQSYRLEIDSPVEQYDVKVNRLFPMLRRYWLHPDARQELPKY